MSAFKRSPNFPFIPLETAIERAGELYKQEGRNAVNIKVAVSHWGYKETSSGGKQTVAALKAYGLIEYFGKGDDRKIKLSRLALMILLDEREDSYERQEAIKVTALNPKIFKELWLKWGVGGLPSDANISHFLIFEKDVNEKSTGDLIKNFKSTISFASLTPSDSIQDEEDDDSGEEGSNERQPHYPQVKPPPKKPGMKQDIFTLDEGQVVLQWPAKLSQDSYEDFEGWINLILRRAKRSIVQEPDISEIDDDASS